MRAAVLLERGIVGIMLTMFAAYAFRVEQATAENLQRQLEERDRKIEAQGKIIQELLRRVEQLEHGIAVTRQASPAPSAVAAAPATPRARAEASGQPAVSPAPRGDGKAGKLKVDEEAAERALDRALVAQGALLVPFKRAEVQPTFEYSREETNNSFATTVNGSPTLANARVKRNEFTPSLQFRVGLPWDSQLELGIPYNVVNQDVVRQMPGMGRSAEDKTGSAFSDVSLDLAKTVLRQKSWWPSLITRLNYDSGSGQKVDAGVPLDGGFSSFGGQLVALRRQDPLAFVASAFYRNSFTDNDVRPGNQFGASLGTSLATSPETSLSVSLQQTFIDDLRVRGSVINESDQVQSTLVVGASSILERNVLLFVSGGVGLTSDADDYFVEVALPIRFDLPLP